MPDETFWRKRFQELGSHSVGPGDTQDEESLEAHRQFFVRGAGPWLERLQGPVLDFGCGVGRWVMDLPRPYLGLDLLPEHIEICRQRYGHLPDVSFQLSNTLDQIPDQSQSSIFTCTVLQHIVEKNLRKFILKQFYRILKPDSVLLSIEWSEGQREFDWCRPVARSEFARWFDVAPQGEVIENNRRHTIWYAVKRKQPKGFRLWDLT